jgi:hypothetical protein
MNGKALLVSVACAFAALALVPAAFAQGSSPSDPVPLVSGVPLHGDSSHALADVNGVLSEFSAITLRQGDFLTINWAQPKNGLNSLDLLAPGQTDTSWPTAKPLASLPPWSEGPNGAVYKLSLHRSITSAGLYLFRAYADGEPSGPYTLTVIVHRGPHAAATYRCPFTVTATAAAGHPFELHVAMYGIVPSTPNGLGFFIALERLPSKKRVELIRSGDDVRVHGQWLAVYKTAAPLRPGRYQFAVAPLSIVGDPSGYACIPAPIARMVTVK